MEAELKQALPSIEVQLIEGDNGIFDVHADEELIFSRHEQGRFPQPGELSNRLRRPTS